MRELFYILAICLVFVATGIIGSLQYKKARKQFFNNLHRGQTIHYYNGHHLFDAKVMRVLREKKEVQLTTGKYIPYSNIITDYDN